MEVIASNILFKEDLCRKIITRGFVRLRTLNEIIDIEGEDNIAESSSYGGICRFKDGSSLHKTMVYGIPNPFGYIIDASAINKSLLDDYTGIDYVDYDMRALDNADYIFVEPVSNNLLFVKKEWVDEYYTDAHSKSKTIEEEMQELLADSYNFKNMVKLSATPVIETDEHVNRYVYESYLTKYSMVLEQVSSKASGKYRTYKYVHNEVEGLTFYHAKYVTEMVVRNNIAMMIVRSVSAMMLTESVSITHADDYEYAVIDISRNTVDIIDFDDLYTEIGRYVNAELEVTLRLPDKVENSKIYSLLYE